MPGALAAWLRAEGTEVRLVVADHGGLVSSWEADAAPTESSPWNGLEAGDVVVMRSRHLFALALLEQAEALGARTCDRYASVLRVRNKARCASGLSRQGLPIPPTFLAREPADLERLPADSFPLLLKPVFGDNARGLRLVREPSELAALEWTEDLVLAQGYLDAGGVDLKIYVAGEAVWAVRRPSPLTGGPDAPTQAPVTPALRRLATRCRAEFQLVLFGLDILESKQGPVIVDVNEFPNYTGVDEAPAVIGRLLLDVTGASRLETSQEAVSR